MSPVAHSRGAATGGGGPLRRKFQGISPGPLDPLRHPFPECRADPPTPGLTRLRSLLYFPAYPPSPPLIWSTAPPASQILTPPPSPPTSHLTYPMIFGPTPSLPYKIPLTPGLPYSHTCLTLQLPLGKIALTPSLPGSHT